MKVKSPPPPGAMMYSLLLLAHMTLAVTANTTFTAGVTPESPQSVTHADRHTDAASVHIPAPTKVLGTSAPHTEALTDGHTDTTPAHILVSHKVLGTSDVHTEAFADTDTTPAHIPVSHKVLGTSAVHREAFADTDTTPAHIPVSHKVLGTSAVHTDRHTDAASVHIPAPTKVLGTSAPHTVHHSTIVSEQISVTKKELQSATQKTHTAHITLHHSTIVSEQNSTGIHSAVTKKLQSVPQKTHATHITKSISVPNVSVELANGFQITCFSDSGPEVITYELIQGDRIVKNLTVHGRKPATFQFDITPGPSKIYCRARTLSGEEETSEPLKIEGDNPDSEDKPGDSKKSDKEEWDAAPKFLISLTYILTSVSQPVQDLNAIIISVCGPVILIVLLLVFLTHFCNRRGRKAGSTRLVCCV